MKTLRPLLLFLVLGLFVPLASYGNGVSSGTMDRREKPKSGNLECKVIQRGSAPLSAVIEDAVAYALDIPLAMLSPLTSLIGPCEEEADLRAGKAPARRRK